MSLPPKRRPSNDNPSPAQHPLDVLDGIAADVLGDVEAAERFAANDLASALNQAAGRQVTTPDDVLRFARIPLEYEPGPDIEIPTDALHSLDEVFGDDGETT